MTDIANLTATLQFIAPNDADRLLAPIIQAQAEFEKFDALVKRFPASLARSQEAQQYRNEYVLAANTLQGKLEAASRQVVELASAFQQAGIPLKNLNSLTETLRITAEGTAKALYEMSKTYRTANPLKPGGKDFDVRNTADGMVNMSTTKTGALSRALLDAWHSTVQLDDAMKATTQTAQRLLTSQAQNSSAERTFRTQSAHVYSAQRSLEDYEKTLARVQEQGQLFSTAMTTAFSAMRTTAFTASSAIKGHFTSIEEAANKAAQSVLRAAGAATAAGSGSTRATPEAMAARRAAQVEVEEQRRQTELMMEAERRRQELARFAAAETLAQTRATAAAARAEVERTNALNALARQQQRANQEVEAAARAAAQAATPWGMFAQSLQGVNQWSGALSGPLANMAGRFITLQQAVAASTPAIVAWGVGLSAAAGGLITLFNQMVRVERIMGPVRELHMSLAKTQGEDGVANLEMLIQTMAKYGLSIEHLSKPLARLKIATDGTLLGGERFKTFVDDFSAVASKFALPQESIAGMAKAFEQMISKGTVQAEEFRQQLGDRLPGAARIGLETFRVMTGNAQASFEQFMKAMKDRQIESTRFLDIFMIKLKETYGITNEAGRNLNTVYGQLVANRDIAINKLDQAAGVTAAWGTVLSGLVNVLKFAGDASTFFGTSLQGLAAVGALLALRFIPLTAVFGGLRMAFLALQGLFVSFSVGQIMQVLTSVSAGAVRLIGDFLGINKAVEDTQSKIKALNFGKELLDNLKKVSDAGVGLQTISFKVRGDLVDKDTGQPLFDNPETLLREARRYIANVEQGLRQGQKITLDFDLVGQLDKQIEAAKARLEALSANMAAALDRGKAFREGLFPKLQEDTQAFILNDLAVHRRGQQEKFRLIEQEYTHRTDVYGRIYAFMQRESAKQTAVQIAQTQATIKANEDMRARLLAIQEQMSKIKAGDSVALSIYERLIKFANDWHVQLKAVGAVLGIIATINLGGLLLGIQGLGVAAMTLGGILTGLQARFVLLIGAATAISMLMSTNAKAAENGYAGIRAQVDAATESIRANNGVVADFERTTVAYTAGARNVDQFKMRQAELRAELDRVAESIRRVEAEGPRRPNGIFGRMSGIDLNANALQLLRAELERIKAEYNQNESRIASMTGALTPLASALKTAAAENAEFARTLEQLGISMDGVGTKTLPNIAAEIRKASERLRVLRTEGAEGLRVFDQINAMRGKYSTGDKDSAVPALDAELMRLVQMNRSIDKGLQDIKKETGRIQRMTLEQAEGIIDKSEAIIEGLGYKYGNALKKMSKEVEDFRVAILAKAQADAEAARKAGDHAQAVLILAEGQRRATEDTDRLRTALQMQAEGINMAALQFKPYEALQNNFMKFTDGLVDLMSKGQLNAKNFKKAFADMAMGILADMMKMIIRAMILRPLMNGLFGTFGSGLGMGGMGAMGGGSALMNAKGNVFDTKQAFVSGGRLNTLAESGPEAVMPLRRGVDGSLGVMVTGGGQGGGSTYNVTYNVQTPNQQSFAQSESQMAAMMTRMVSRGKRNA